MADQMMLDMGAAGLVLPEMQNQTSGQWRARNRWRRSGWQCLLKDPGHLIEFALPQMSVNPEKGNTADPALARAHADPVDRLQDRIVEYGLAETVIT